MFRLNPEALRNQTLILAISGGPDSMAMAGYMRQWQKNNPQIRMRAVIVDHGIRARSHVEARTVLSWLDQMGITATIRTITAKAPKAGLQVWAREQRYQVLAEEARIDGAAVTVAHHADDQAETIAMRLSAGSGLNGLAGMAEVTQRDDMTIMRPFLNVPRDQLHQILATEQIPFVNDPSNLNEHFERIAWRSRMDGLNRDGIGPDKLIKLGQLSHQIYEGMAESIRKHLGNAWGVLPTGAVWMSSDAVFSLPDTAACALLRSIAGRFGDARWPVGHDAALRLLKAMRGKGSDGVAATLAGLEWYMAGDVIWIYREAECTPEPAAVTHGAVFYDNAWHVQVHQANRDGSGMITALGSKRAAAMRAIAPAMLSILRSGAEADQTRQAGLRAPMRSLWRYPVYLPDQQGDLGPASKKPSEYEGLSHQVGLIALEDGAIIPHVDRYASVMAFGDLTITLRDCRLKSLI